MSNRIQCPQCGGNDIVREVVEIDQSDDCLASQYGYPPDILVCVDCLWEMGIE